jgi:hypothetical protein
MPEWVKDWRSWLIVVGLGLFVARWVHFLWTGRDSADD